VLLRVAKGFTARVTLLHVLKRFRDTKLLAVLAKSGHTVVVPRARTTQWSYFLLTALETSRSFASLRDALPVGPFANYN